jgi:AcrR family transcriptional regulator
MTRADRRPRQRLDPPQRRAAILDAAREAFASAPYEQVSLASVARAAGASQALVHKYFATKAALYAEVVREAIESLLARQRAADARLGPAATARDRLATSIEVYLDFIASAPRGWAAPLRDHRDGVPGEAAELRTRARARYVTLLRQVLDLPPGDMVEHALRGYIGFLDAACLSWVTAGYPRDQRPALVATALGALDGALHAALHAALAPAGDSSPASSDRSRGRRTPGEPRGS